MLCFQTAIQKFGFSSNQTSFLTLSRLDSIRASLIVPVYDLLFGTEHAHVKSVSLDIVHTCSNLTENSAHGTTLRNNIVPQRLIKRLISNYTLITTQHGAIKGKTQKSQFKFYSLDAIITVGYRVNSIGEIGAIPPTWRR